VIEFPLFTNKSGYQVLTALRLLNANSGCTIQKRLSIIEFRRNQRPVMETAVSLSRHRCAWSTACCHAETGWLANTVCVLTKRPSVADSTPRLNLRRQIVARRQFRTQDYTTKTEDISRRIHVEHIVITRLQDHHRSHQNHHRRWMSALLSQHFSIQFNSFQAVQHLHPKWPAARDYRPVAARGCLPPRAKSVLPPPPIRSVLQLGYFFRISRE